MKKVDFKKELKHLYNPSAKEVVIVDVPKMNFLMVDGAGDPNTSQDFKDAVEVLYAVSYALKFMVKKGKAAIDYGVMPLEGLWWADDMSKFSMENKDIWKWTVMIMQPEYVTKELFNKALEQVEKKKRLPALSKIRFESFQEGPSAQIMHIGPYSAEGPTIEKIHNFAKGKGYKLAGKHREIYLSDPRKAAPDKMKTILRQPIATQQSMSEIIEKLRGGDLRFIGKSDGVVSDILENPELFGEVFEGMVSDDAIIRMRSADVIEKVSRLHPEYLKPYKERLIKDVSKIDQQEVRWHVAQMFSYLNLEKNERKRVITMLFSWIESSSSKIVKVNSMQTLADFAEIDSKLRPLIINKLKELTRSGSPAIISRGRKLIEKLTRQS